MKRIKSVKRLLVGVATTLTVLATSIVPAFAADEAEPVDAKSDAIAEKTIEVENLVNYKFIDESAASKYGLDPFFLVDENIDSIVTRAGAETWSGSGFGGAYTFTNNNLTPVKTMGKTGRLLISGYFYGNDGFASSHPIKLTVEIRSTSGTVLARTIEIDDRSGNVDFAVAANVTAGQKIQLFFDASSVSTSPGIYRSAYVAYDYSL